MKNSVKVAVTKVVTNNTNKLQNAINSLDALIENPKSFDNVIVKPTKKVVVAPKVTYKEQIEGNAKFKNAMQVECKKLGYALSLLESHLDCFAPLVQDYIKSIRNEQILYKLAELNAPKSKSGNFTAWLLQSYIRNTINKAK